ncbi:hypothetical protein FGO68_gene11159 [Halteria grandinella]|uniref:Uncharacterized protein n=1 Tax=Halteria grandinella TaxID=5974 RepID=A0A8J8NYB7_HALGN|nr:hypothetical protein FGO68_gene11159 [Halteria grandinella]
MRRLTAGLHTTFVMSNFRQGQQCFSSLGQILQNLPLHPHRHQPLEQFEVPIHDPIRRRFRRRIVTW